MASSDNMVRSTEQLGNDVENAEAEVRDRTRALAADPWGAAIQRQQRERNAQNGMGTYNQMRDLVRRQQLDELNNGVRAEEAIASALKIAKGRKDGQIPGVVVDYLNRQFGFDGKTSGLMGGGIDEKTKDFNFVFGERDQAGNIVQRKKTIPLAVQLGLMEGYTGMFSPEEIAAHREEMGKRFSPQEIDSYSKVAQFARDKRAKRMEELTPRERTQGWSPERVQIEQGKLGIREKELAARIARGNAGNDLAKLKNATNVAKSMNDIMLAIGVDPDSDQGKKLRENLGSVIMGQVEGMAVGGGQQPTATPAPVQQPQAQQGGDVGGQFKELSRDEYAKLGTEEKQKYREAWKNWKASQKNKPDER